MNVLKTVLKYIKEHKWKVALPVAVSILIAMFIVLQYLMVLHAPQRPRPSPGPPYGRSFEEAIKDGDAAFKAYDYEYALQLYRAANRQLSDLIQFEDHSPAKEPQLLQHYYNSLALLKTKTELTLIAIEIKRFKELRR